MRAEQFVQDVQKLRCAMYSDNSPWSALINRDKCLGGRQWDSWALLMSSAADEKELFLWREVFDGPQPLCQRGLFQRVCDQGGRGWPQSLLPASGSWRDGKLQSVTPSAEQMNTTVCPCSWQRQWHTTWWWRRWGWIQGWHCNECLLMINPC